MHCGKWHRSSITSSASCWRCSGTSGPKAFAAFIWDHGGERVQPGHIQGGPELRMKRRPRFCTGRAFIGYISAKRAISSLSTSIG